MKIKTYPVGWGWVGEVPMSLPDFILNTTIIVKSHSVENSEISLLSVKFDEISATPVGFH